MNEKSTSVAASILSLACTIAGMSIYSNLSKWWHFILAACIIVSMYFLLYIIVETVKKIYFRFFSRADISSNDEQDISSLRQKNVELLFYDALYDKCTNAEQKEAIRESIFYLCTQQEAKIEWIKVKATSSKIRKPLILPRKDFLVPYSLYCDIIKKKYNLK